MAHSIIVRRRHHVRRYVALAACGLAASSGLAAGVSVTGVAQQSFQAEEGSRGSSLTSVTDLGMSVGFQTSATKLTLVPGVRSILSTDSEQTDLLAPRFSGALSIPGKSTDLTASASFVPNPTSARDFDQRGVTNETALALDFRASIGLAHRVDPRNTLSVTLSADATEYAEHTRALQPRRSVGVNGGWTRQLDPVSKLKLNGGVERFQTEGSSGDSTVLSSTIGVERSVNRRLSVNGDIGVSFVSGRDDTESLIGGFGFVYMMRQMSFGADFSQRVEQNTLGELENRSSLSANVSFPINARSQLSLNTGFGFQNPLAVGFNASGNRTTFTIGPAFTHKLSEDWSVSARYTFRIEDDDRFRTSNVVFLSISRNLAF